MERKRRPSEMLVPSSKPFGNSAPLKLDGLYRIISSSLSIKPLHKKIALEASLAIAFKKCNGSGKWHRKEQAETTSYCWSPKLSCIVSAWVAGSYAPMANLAELPVISLSS